MNESLVTARRLDRKPEPLSFDQHGKGIVALTVQTPTSQQISTASSRPPLPARWRSPEFLLYALVFIIVVPQMVYYPIQLSNESHPNYYMFQGRLSPGWIAGRRMDNTDHQYRTFRGNLLSLCALAAVYLALAHAYKFLTSTFGARSTGKRSDNLHRIPFIAIFTTLMIIGLHGASALKILMIITLNYFIGKRAATFPYGPIIIWFFNLVVLFANELQDGYRFASLHSSLNYLDELKGFYPRWHITFNIAMLRLLSFNMDYRWAHREFASSTAVPMNSRQRSSNSHPLEAYNYLTYYAYVLYPPLYIAGPIMSFNDFLWQLRRPTSVTTDYLLGYALRFIVCLLTMETVLHYMYVVVIKDTRAWIGDSPMELSMIGLWNLIIIWLKLLLPWRFFRLWALLDEMDPPENMIRCMANNYTVSGFWRGWHRSYNQWLIRYLYIPLGGSDRVILATLVTFTFVALWHDLQLRLLAWGWLITLFILPELVLKKIFSEKKFGEEWWYRHLCAIGGVGNMFMLLVANLIGFVLGLDGVQYLSGQLMGSWSGVGFVLMACICLFVGVQVMMEYREEEKRRGIYRKC